MAKWKPLLEENVCGKYRLWSISACAPTLVQLILNAFSYAFGSNALMANVGMPQTRKYKDENGETHIYVEGKLITIGDEVDLARNFAKQDKNGEWSFSAGDVVEYLKSEWDESAARQELQSVLEKESEKMAKVTAETAKQ